MHVSFSVSQSLDGQTLVITDTSPYSAPDAISNIASRHVSVALFDGSFLGGSSSVNFPIVSGAGDILQIPITKDYAIAVTMVDTPVSAQGGSVYTLTSDFTLLNNSKAKYRAREYRLTAGLVSCEQDYADVDYSILRWIDNASDAYLNSDQRGSQRYLDKINSIGLNDCIC